VHVETADGLPELEGIKTMTNDRAQDELLDNATHAAAAVFETSGIRLTSDELYRINDLLTEILGERIPTTDFPITLIGDKDHVAAQRATVNRLLRKL
jgi:hypothetical protein